MAALWTAAALLGLNALFALVPPAYVIIKTAGALYLIWIAWQTWKHARDPLGAPPRPVARAFLGGLLVNLANPKSVLFAAAVLIVVFPPELSVAQKAFIVLNHLVVEFFVGVGLVLMLSTDAVSRRYLRMKTVFDRIAAGILGLLGLRLLFQR
ncbi:LysE family translocator [Primorskyibacter sp. S187A]|uniref:LysE family translocator n=1 Tax=Primorskyibacter sp. S187A TaxID=3415130 RepID=UPI003C7CDE5F